MKQAILDTFKALAMFATTQLFKLVLWAEKCVYRHTGVLLPLLRGLWRRQGARLQRKLNAEHGTAIQYGYIN